MKKYRLRDSHPDFEKFNKLCGLAEELGIRIHTSGVLSCHIGDMEYSIEDIENSDDITPDFPPIFEVKLTFKK